MVKLRKIIVLNKKEGETPLEALSSFRAKNREYKDESITYAGRLDPMAQGVLVLLVGDKIKEKEEYLALTKEYEFEVLFGFATDTYDILGKVISAKNPNQNLNLKESILKNLKYFSGKLIQKYPPYSSKTVKGKPLFAYSRSGEEVEIPSREVFVKRFDLIKIKKISGDKLLQNIEKRIKKVNGDFRQKEILKIWRKKIPPKSEFFLVGFKIKCSSGTYVRGIANNLGERINIPALAFSIKRTKVGKYSLKNSK